MNLYLRYFDNEILVSSVNEALDFLSSIDEINLTDDLKRDFCEYVASDVYYPKRYKVRPRIYFIVIKTEAETMLDFKQKKALRSSSDFSSSKAQNPELTKLNLQKYGWYEGRVLFKRVVVNPATGKCEYRDTEFVANCKANSGKECYDLIIEHLSMRVDPRSQFPSVKGENYSFKFLGLCK